MPRARIQINAATTTFASVTIGSTVQLSNDDEGGELTYAWSITDQPEGTNDTLSSGVIENPTFSPTKEGSYEVRLVVNALLGTQSIQTAIVAVLDARSRERFPAATETTEVSTSRGWAAAVNRILIKAMRDYAGGGGTVIAQTPGPGGIAAGSIVNFRGVATINSGTQAQDVVPMISLATAVSAENVLDRLGFLVDGVVNGQTGAGSLVIVQTFGIVPQVVAAGSASVGDPVFVSDVGFASLSAGTNSRRIGRVVSFGGGVYRWCIDNTAVSPSVPPGRLISTTSPLAGGGDLSADRTLSIVNFGTGAAGAVTASGAASSILRGDNTWSTPTQITAALDLFSSTLKGLVPASGGGTSNFLRADLSWAPPSTIVTFATFGNGGDGAAVFDGVGSVTGFSLAGSTYTAQRSCFFTTVTVSVGVIVKPDGWPQFANQTWTNNGTVSVSGSNASGTTAGSPAWVSGRMLPAGLFGAGSGSGGSNSANNAPFLFVAGNAAAGTAGASPGVGGSGNIGQGGGGGGALSNAGGVGGAVAVSSAANGDVRQYHQATRARNESGSLYTCGSPGGGGGNGGPGVAGGAGGASGSWMIICAAAFAGSGIFESRGGNGGNGANAGAGTGFAGAGGGGGGAGGVLVVIRASGSAPSTSVSGGSGGTGGVGDGAGPTGAAGGSGGSGILIAL